jgi:hypothetical protein
MKKSVIIFLTTVLLIFSISSWAPETRHTGKYVTIKNVAFQGEGDRRYGWPVKVNSFDEAIRKARRWGINAFHYYVSPSRHAGDMYPLKNITGYEPRGGDYRTIGVIMELTSVHQKDEPQASVCSIYGSATGARKDFSREYRINLYGPRDRSKYRASTKFSSDYRYSFLSLPKGKYWVVPDTKGDFGWGPTPSYRIVDCKGKVANIDFNF